MNKIDYFVFSFCLLVLLSLPTHLWPSWGTVDCPGWEVQPAQSWREMFWKPEESERTPAPPPCTGFCYTRRTSASALQHHRSEHNCNIRTCTNTSDDRHFLLWQKYNQTWISCVPGPQPGRWVYPGAADVWAVQHPVAGIHLICRLQWSEFGKSRLQPPSALGNPYSLQGLKYLQGDRIRLSK